MTKTVINSNIEQAVIGYIVNSAFTEANKKLIAGLQEQLADTVGDVIWLTPSDALHITFLDWIAPLVDYADDKDQLFKQIYEVYDSVTEKIIQEQSPITIHFNEVRVAPAAVFIVGEDHGQYADMRSSFLRKVTLLPNTKAPPRIIHSTIGRFTKEVDLAPFERMVEQFSIDFSQTVTDFRLLRETLDPLLEFEVLKTYSAKAT